MKEKPKRKNGEEPGIFDNTPTLEQELKAAIELVAQLEDEEALNKVNRLSYDLVTYSLYETKLKGLLIAVCLKWGLGAILVLNTLVGVAKKEYGTTAAVDGGCFVLFMFMTIITQYWSSQNYRGKAEEIKKEALELAGELGLSRELSDEEGDEFFILLAKQYDTLWKQHDQALENKRASTRSRTSARTFNHALTQDSPIQRLRQEQESAGYVDEEEPAQFRGQKVIPRQ
jgi:hypothetical protein